MRCKKCGRDVELYYYSALVKESVKCYKNRNERIPQILLKEYKNHNRFFGCEKCGEPIDYKDMPIDMFFNWLKYSSEAGDSRKDSGKAIIRYFELDELLGLKKEEGD